MSESGGHKFIPDLFTRAKQVPFDVVLSELGLLDHLQVAGDEIRGKCPLCGGERSFSANPVKGVFTRLGRLAVLGQVLGWHQDPQNVLTAVALGK